MSDMGINYSTYKLTPLQLAMNPIQGAYIDGMSGEWFLDNNNKPYPNDVSKSIILIIKDTFFGTPVSGATIEIAWMGISGPSITWVDRYYEHGNDPEYLGQYEVHLNTTGLNVTSATSYRMQLNATKAYYLGVETILNLEILPLPLAIIPSSFSPTVFENESTTISVSIIESFNQLQITTANVRWHIKERPSINGTMEHVLMGVYQGIIDLHAEDTFLASGNYTLVYNVTTSITEQRTLELPLKVIGKTSVNIEFSRVPGSTSLGAGTFETFEFILSTMDGTPMQGKKLTITFTVTLRSGIGDITRFNRETDGNGIASLSVQLPETWRSFTVEVSFDGSGTTYATESVSHPDTFRVNTEVERVMLAIESSWIPIVACIAALVVLLAVRMRQVRKRRHEWSKDAEEIRDITKIKHILIIDKISGMMLLQRSYSHQKLEGALVSGFLSAITSFGDEVGYHVRDRKKDSEDTMFFDYKDFKIILIEGKNVKAAMFLGDTPTEHLREHLRSFIVKFEEKYNVENWNGDMSLFNDVDSLIESCCEITIIYPLVINENANKSKVRSRLGRSLLKAAEATQSISQVFYLSTLVKYGTAYRNESPLQVLSEIYRLKREGFFIPYKGPDNTLS